MPVTNWRSPSTTISSNSVTNPDNVFALDAADASFDGVNDTATWGNLGDFQIPANATITGVEFRVYGQRTSGTNNTMRWRVRDSGSTYRNKNITLDVGSDSYKTVGGDGDLWSGTWTPAGFANGTVRVQVDFSAVSVTHDVDHIELRVYYTVPKIETLTDNFNDNSIDTGKWTSSLFTERNQRLEVSASGDEAEFRSANSFTLEASAFLFEYDHDGLAVESGNQITTMRLYAPGQENEAGWLVATNSGNTLNAFVTEAGVETVLAGTTYNSTTHRWLRIREDSGTIYWDYSADGLNWSNLTSRSVSGFDTDSLKSMRFYFYTLNESGNTHINWIDNFNNPPQVDTYAITKSLKYTVKVTPSAITKALIYAIEKPLVETLTDNFDDSSLDSGKWGNFTDSGGTIVETTVLTFTPQAATSGSQALIFSQNRYKLIGSSASLRVNTASHEGVASYLVLQLDGSNQVSMGFSDGDIYAAKKIAGSDTVLNDEPYDSDVHKWLRIRESAGTIYFDYSTDGVNWVNLSTLVNPFSLQSLQVSIGFYEWGTPATPAAYVVDNFNLPPQVTSEEITKALTYKVLDSNSVTKSLKYTIFTVGLLEKDLNYFILTSSVIQKSLVYKVIDPNSVTKSLKYTVKISTSLTKFLKYTVLVADSITKSLKYAVVNSSVATKQLIYKIADPNSVTKSLQYIVKSPKSVTKSLKYDVLNIIDLETDLFELAFAVSEVLQKTLIYKVKAPHTVQLSLKYTVLADQSITKNLTYAVRLTDSVTKVLVYKVKADQAITKSLKYTVVAPASVTKSLKYTILTTDQIELDLVYKVKSGNAITKSLQYIVVAPASITKSLKYTVLTSDSVTKQLIYSVRTQTTIQKSLKYTVVDPNAVTKFLKYTVLTTDSVTKDLVYKIVTESAITKSLKYIIVGQAFSIQLTLRYRVLTVDAIQKSLKYTIITTSVIQKSLVYAVETQATIAKTLIYKVLVANSITKSLNYEILTTQLIQKSFTYSVLTLDSITKSLKYAVVLNNAVTKSLKYTVLAEVEIQKSLTYRISLLFSITKSLTYRVQGEPLNIAKSLIYRVRTSISITKSLKYVLISYINKPLTHLQHQNQGAIMRSKNEAVNLKNNENKVRLISKVTKVKLWHK